MQTQINCPACGTQFVGDVHQIIDVGQEPELKEMLLSGYLNVVQCPSCSSVTQVGTPLLYHDPEHELFLVYVPMEMSLAHEDREKLIGQMVRQTMDRLPAEQRRGYMLQPETILSMQTLMEMVLETEGITPEMMARQRSQAELLQELLSADKETVDRLIQDREDEFDDMFFAMLRALIDSAQSAGQEDQVLILINLQARLFRETDFGQGLERQQQAIHAISREAKQAGGLSPKLLLQHVLANRSDERIVDALVMGGQQAFNYDFFMLLSEKIEKRKKSGISTDELEALREHLLNLQQQMEKHSREVMAEAQRTLTKMLAAEDKRAEVRANAGQLDDVFMLVMSTNMAQAQEQGDAARIDALQEIQNAIVQEMEQQAPPEVRLVNQLLRAGDDEGIRQVLDKNPDMVKPELLEMLGAISEQANDSGDQELIQRLGHVQSVVAAQLVT